ncbi:MAG: hypothetical protein ACYDCS_07710 [Candidatus Dormibacteria bacterium]
MTVEQDAARLVAKRVEQGLPEHVEDPVALARIADALIADDALEPYRTTGRGQHD